MAGKWCEDMIYRAYACAATGMSLNQIAPALGVNASTLTDWREKYPVIDRAIEAGWASSKAPAQLREEWVFARLEPHLKALWMDIESLWETNPESLFDRLRGVKETEKQSLFLYALSGTAFSTNTAMSMVGIGKKTLDKWLDDPKFAELAAQIEWHKDNFIEDRFLGLIKSGYEPAILWATRTKLANRGYGQSVKVSGEVEHTHTIGINLHSLGLPPELMDAVVASMLSGPRVGPDGLIMDLIGESPNDYAKSEDGNG